jgi:hypothetical protein
MTERSADQAPLRARPEAQDTQARVPLAERLQRRISAAADERRASAQAPQESARVLPPPPQDLLPTQQPGNHVEQPARAQHQGPTTPQTPAPRRTTPTAPVRGPRRARLRLSRIDPWSVMKVAFLLSIAFGIVTVVSVFMVWSVLGAAGVWDSINNTVSDTVSSGTTASTFNIQDYVGMSRVLGFTMLVSVIDVILITAISTLGAFLYNMAASLLGGIEVTLSEDHS